MLVCMDRSVEQVVGPAEKLNKPRLGIGEVVILLCLGESSGLRGTEGDQDLHGPYVVLADFGELSQAAVKDLQGFLGHAVYLVLAFEGGIGVCGLALAGGVLATAFQGLAGFDFLESKDLITHVACLTFLVFCLQALTYPSWLVFDFPPF
jgi:hypothetical protein